MKIASTLKNSDTVIAEITSIHSEYNSDDDSYWYVYYGDYVIDGREYSNVKLMNGYESNDRAEYNDGDYISVKVNHDNPPKVNGDGKRWIVIGLLFSGLAFSEVLQKHKGNNK